MRAFARTRTRPYTHMKDDNCAHRLYNSALNNLYVSEIWAICARHMNEYDDCVVYFIGSLSVFFGNEFA